MGFNGEEARGDRFVRGALEVGRRLVVGVDKHLDGGGLEVFPHLELQEVKSHEIVKVALQGLVVAKVCSIIELGELQKHLHYFGLVLGAQAVVLGPSEDSLDTLVHHLRADWILMCVQLRIEACMLLWKDQHRFENFCFHISIGFFNSCLDIWPYIWGVVSVQVNDLFYLEFSILRVFALLLALVCDCVQVVLICLPSNNVNSLVHAHSWVSIAVLLLILSQDSIV